MWCMRWSDPSNPFFFVHCSRHVSVSFFFCHSPFQRSVHYGQCSCLHNVLSVRQGNPDFSTQGVELTFYPSSHFAPKNFKVVASSKKLVTIFYYDQKKIYFDPADTVVKSDERWARQICTLQTFRLPKSKMAVDRACAAFPKQTKRGSLLQIYLSNLSTDP